VTNQLYAPIDLSTLDKEKSNLWKRDSTVQILPSHGPGG